jgi:hypothetical protein
MMSHVVTCIDMLQSNMTHLAFQFTPDSRRVVFPCLASSVVVLSREKLIFIFAKFKMAASAPSIKELYVSKQCCDALNASHGAFKEKPEACAGLDDKEGPSIQKRQRICDKCRKSIANLPENFGNEALVSSSSGYE